MKEISSANTISYEPEPDWEKILGKLETIKNNPCHLDHHMTKY
jgi:hypothetical protein